MLPDGSKIKLGREKYTAPEILFQPKMIGLEYPPIHQLLANSIKKADIDLRRKLYKEIHIAGGTTFISGFAERLYNEFKNIVPNEIKKKIYTPPERNFSCWMGGSILSALPSFKKMWITKAVILSVIKLFITVRTIMRRGNGFYIRSPFEISYKYICLLLI